MLFLPGFFSAFVVTPQSGWGAEGVCLLGAVAAPGRPFPTKLLALPDCRLEPTVLNFPRSASRREKADAGGAVPSGLPKRSALVCADTRAGRQLLRGSPGLSGAARAEVALQHVYKPASKAFIGDGPVDQRAHLTVFGVVLIG